jgi:hypothetical protein
LRRSFRTHAAPERLLGASFLRWPASLSFTLALLELSGVAMVWLVFYPPAAYRRWINRESMPHARVA